MSGIPSIAADGFIGCSLACRVTIAFTAPETGSKPLVRGIPRPGKDLGLREMRRNGRIAFRFKKTLQPDSKVDFLHGGTNASNELCVTTPPESSRNRFRPQRALGVGSPAASPRSPHPPDLPSRNVPSGPELSAPSSRLAIFPVATRKMGPPTRR